MKNFGLIGAAGYIAPRHMKAIKDTGNQMVAALDPSDSVGIIDSYFPQADFFTEFERFDRHVDKLRRAGDEKRLDFVSICSPNYLHDAHIRLALRVGAHAICEKPIVINPWNLDALEEIEHESGRTVNTVLQLRLHPSLIALKQRLDAEPSGRQHDVCLTYITARGAWYSTSWKGSEERSGGLVTNIGIHFFDLLIWLFGPVVGCRLHQREPERMAGFIELERARVQWLLSTRTADLPFAPEPGVKTTFRSITVDGQEIEFSEGFNDLHTRVYEQVLAGNGFRIADARPSITLTHQLRHAEVSPADAAPRHPLLAKA